MKTFFQTVLGVLLVIGIFLGVTWGVTGNAFYIYKYFAPEYAKVERQVFENTPSYKKGMAQELRNMQFEYVKCTDPQHKKALGSIILHRISDPTDFNNLPNDLKEFVTKLRVEALK